MRSFYTIFIGLTLIYACQAASYGYTPDPTLHLSLLQSDGIFNVLKTLEVDGQPTIGGSTVLAANLTSDKDDFAKFEIVVQNDLKNISLVVPEHLRVWLPFEDSPDDIMNEDINVGNQTYLMEEMSTQMFQRQAITLRARFNFSEETEEFGQLNYYVSIPTKDWGLPISVGFWFNPSDKELVILRFGEDLIIWTDNFEGNHRLQARYGTSWVKAVLSPTSGSIWVAFVSEGTGGTKSTLYVNSVAYHGEIWKENKHKEVSLDPNCWTPDSIAVPPLMSNLENYDLLLTLGGRYEVNDTQSYEFQISNLQIYTNYLFSEDQIVLKGRTTIRRELSSGHHTIRFEDDIHYGRNSYRSYNAIFFSDLAASTTKGVTVDVFVPGFEVNGTAISPTWEVPQFYSTWETNSPIIKLSVDINHAPLDLIGSNTAYFQAINHCSSTNWLYPSTTFSCSAVTTRMKKASNRFYFQQQMKGFISETASGFDLLFPPPGKNIITPISVTFSTDELGTVEQKFFRLKADNIVYFSAEYSLGNQEVYVTYLDLFTATFDIGTVNWNGVVTWLFVCDGVNTLSVYANGRSVGTKSFQQFFGWNIVDNLFPTNMRVMPAGKSVWHFNFMIFTQELTLGHAVALYNLNMKLVDPTTYTGAKTLRPLLESQFQFDIFGPNPSGDISSSYTIRGWNAAHEEAGPTVPPQASYVAGTRVWDDSNNTWENDAWTGPLVGRHPGDGVTNSGKEAVVIPWVQYYDAPEDETTPPALRSHKNVTLSSWVKLRQLVIGPHRQVKVVAPSSEGANGIELFKWHETKKSPIVIHLSGEKLGRNLMVEIKSLLSDDLVSYRDWFAIATNGRTGEIETVPLVQEGNTLQGWIKTNATFPFYGPCPSGDGVLCSAFGDKLIVSYTTGVADAPTVEAEISLRGDVDVHPRVTGYLLLQRALKDNIKRLKDIKLHLNTIKRSWTSYDRMESNGLSLQEVAEESFQFQTVCLHELMCHTRDFYWDLVSARPPPMK